MYKYTHLIKENIAPVGAKSIGIYNENGKRVGGFGLARLKPPTENKLYSFLAISDVHIQVSESKYKTAEADFRGALGYAENHCDFTCICGDLTSEGTEAELNKYKGIVDEVASKPVYAMAGNHETWHGIYATDDNIKPYTGYPLYYTVSNAPTDEVKRNYYNGTVGEDIFIFVGYYGAFHDYNKWNVGEFISTEEIQWLYETLEANREKRCFVFIHPFPQGHGVGNANNLYTNVITWQVTDGGTGQALINLLRHYKNTIVFHGHSHLRFWMQELESTANYSGANGYRSVHIPSLAVPRDVVNGSVSQITEESEGYIVDVYEDCIVLNGRDFIDNDKDGHILPIATYKIDTTLKTVEANTFTDSTGTIKIN